MVVNSLARRRPDVHLLRVWSQANTNGAKASMVDVVDGQPGGTMLDAVRGVNLWSLIPVRRGHGTRTVRSPTVRVPCCWRSRAGRQGPQSDPARPHPPHQCACRRPGVHVDRPAAFDRLCAGEDRACSIDDIDTVEINEAFAPCCVWPGSKRLSADPEKVNPERRCDRPGAPAGRHRGQAVHHHAQRAGNASGVATGCRRCARAAAPPTSPSSSACNFAPLPRACVCTARTTAHARRGYSTNADAACRCLIASLTIDSISSRTTAGPRGCRPPARRPAHPPPYCLHQTGFQKHRGVGRHQDLRPGQFLTVAHRQAVGDLIARSSLTSA